MLRLKCSSYESTIDNLEKEKASLLKVTKILSSSEDRVPGIALTLIYSPISKEPTDGSEQTEVSNSRKRKTRKENRIKQKQAKL